MNSKKIPYLLFIVLVSLIPSSVFSQAFTAAFDRGKILIGEQVMLTARLENFDPSLQIVEIWHVPDSANHLEVVKRMPLDTVVIGGTQTFVQQFAITSFDSGQWEFPPLTLKITDRQTGKTRTLTSLPLPLSVLPVNVSDLKDYHDIKDIIEVEKQFDWMLFIYAGAGLIVLVILWWIFRRRKKPRIKPVVSPRDALQAALDELKQLEGTALDSAAAVKIYLIRLDAIARTYIEQAQDTPALHQTADELMLSLKTKLPEPTVRTHFFQVLRLISAVKFAKMNATPGEASGALSTVRETIEYMAANKK